MAARVIKTSPPHLRHFPHHQRTPIVHARDLATKLRQKSAIAMSEIKSYHAHVYFNAATMVQAQKLCEEASAMLTPVCGAISSQLLLRLPLPRQSLRFGDSALYR